METRNKNKSMKATINKKERLGKIRLSRRVTSLSYNCQPCSVRQRKALRRPGKKQRKYAMS